MKRKFVSLIPIRQQRGIHLFAVASDGTAWVNYESALSEEYTGWLQISDLPDDDVPGLEVNDAGDHLKALS